MTQPIYFLLLRLWQHTSSRRRTEFGLLLALMILASFAEIFSIGAVLPFLAILTDPELVFAHASVQPIIHVLGLTDSEQLLLPLTIAFGMATIVAGSMRLLLVWVSTRLSFAAGADLSLSIYQRTLYQPYAVHLERNSSEIIDGIVNKTNSTIYLINMTLSLFSSAVMLIAILMALLTFDPVIALSVFGGFGLIYILIVLLTRKRLLINSRVVDRESTYVIKSLQEGLGGIRDVLIDGSQAAYCQIYRNADQPLRRAQGINSFISSSPRYIMESLGMLLIAALAYSLALQDDGLIKAIPILGALALGAQRMLPILQQAYGAWSSIQGGRAQLQSTLDLMDQPLPFFVGNSPTEPIPFLREISLNQISFRYKQDSPWVLEKLTFKILKGSRIGFIGTTGSGKSTLLDLIMGLLQPTTGTMYVDAQPITENNNRAWQAHIAHVPQTIFLADRSIEENIAFGVSSDNIDSLRVRRAARLAQIDSVIESLPNKYQTLVGERGIRLSGGQRQRIGIARALFKKADVIIFDEATSALDSETEKAVMEAIESSDYQVTLLIIAHRISTLKNCTQIFELGDSGIKRSGTYQDIFNAATLKSEKN